ncbi:hypothetical protein [Pseudomonas fluorescens]|uniref:Uncharacterized protein n=1 Tax=Pseudomonas fluorescens TaxID=294 RepID=A0A5E7EXG6_PSEFL|nr:hypothetical protein [Pseudomonas fluorescens]VVO30253.1 hypothetical protein PS723_04931 [Pseudomonas fluorescens]
MTDYNFTKSIPKQVFVTTAQLVPWPLDWLMRKSIDAFSGTVATPENQAAAAASVIRAGKESGVDEMEITMSHEAGLNFKAPIEGVNISMKAGAEGTITMKVKYK